MLKQKLQYNIIFCIMLALFMGAVMFIDNVHADAGGEGAAGEAEATANYEKLKSFNPVEVSSKTGLSRGSGRNPILTVLTSIIKFVVGIVGGLAVLMILVGGIMYITSSGDQGKVDTAKNIIIYAIIGLVVSLLAWIIVNVVITNIK